MLYILKALSFFLLNIYLEIYILVKKTRGRIIIVFKNLHGFILGLYIIKDFFFSSLVKVCSVFSMYLNFLLDVLEKFYVF